MKIWLDHFRVKTDLLGIYKNFLKFLYIALFFPNVSTMCCTATKASPRHIYNKVAKSRDYIRRHKLSEAIPTSEVKTRRTIKR